MDNPLYHPKTDTEVTQNFVAINDPKLPPRGHKSDLKETRTQNDYFMVPLTFHRTTEKLELSLKGKYLVTVTATDTGQLSRTTTIEVSD